MELRGVSVIGHEPLAIPTGRPGTHALNPATGEALPTRFLWASPGEIEDALALAATAAGPMSRSAPAERATFLDRIAAELEALGDAIVARTGLETALPAPRLRAELGRTCGQLRLFADLLRRGDWLDARIDPALPNRAPQPRPDLRSAMRAVGPVVVFGASNFPLAFSVAGGDTASALAAGCPVIVKAHNAHLGASELAARAVQAAAVACGMPRGSFAMLLGEGVELGLGLVGDPRVAAVGFTGSRGAGTALMRAAAARAAPIPVFAEMSSVNPLFILPRALRERGEAIAQGLQASATLGVGQFCTKPGLVFFDAGEAGEAFERALVRAMASVAPGVMLTPGIAEHFHAGATRFSNTPGVRTLLAAQAGAGAPAGCGGTPAVLATDARTLAATPGLREEVFGPVVLLVRCEGAADRLAAARSLEGQLTATVHAQDGELAGHAELLEVLETKAGRLIVNGYPTGVEVCDAMQHGGPFPASSDARFTSVGTRAIARFLRPVCYQGFPDDALPPALRASNPWGVPRRVDGRREA